MPYPSSKVTFTDPAGTSFLAGTPAGGANAQDHAVLHTNINDTVEALEDTVGTTAGTNISMHFSAGQFPIRHTGTLSNGTSNVALVNQASQEGFTSLIGNSGTTMAGTVTFPVAFTSAPVLLMYPIGFKDAPEPTAINQVSLNTQAAILVNSGAITGSNFTFRTNTFVGTFGGTALYYGYTWRAIGPI